jgi:hypothetical protein
MEFWCDKLTQAEAVSRATAGWLSGARRRSGSRTAVREPDAIDGLLDGNSTK